MTELARGRVADRSWGLTLGAFGRHGVSGLLELAGNDGRYAIALDRGNVIRARSPLAADSAARIAVTNHYVSAGQVGAIVRQLTADPDRDEVDVIGEAVKLPAEHQLRLRRKVIAQRAARTFAVTKGEFVLVDEIAGTAACAVDVRPIIHLGAVTHLSYERLMQELRRLGSYVRLKPECNDELSHYGLTEAERAIAIDLDGGRRLDELVTAYRAVDPQTVMAVVYTLVAGLACEILAQPPKLGPSRTATLARPPSAMPVRMAAPVFEPAPTPVSDVPDSPSPSVPPAEPDPVAASPDADRDDLPSVSRVRTKQLLSFVAIPRAPAPPPRTPVGSVGLDQPLVIPRSTTRQGPESEPRRPATPAEAADDGSGTQR